MNERVNYVLGMTGMMYRMGLFTVDTFPEAQEAYWYVERLDDYFTRVWRERHECRRLQD